MSNAKLFLHDYRKCVSLVPVPVVTIEWQVPVPAQTFPVVTNVLGCKWMHLFEHTCTKVCIVLSDCWSRKRRASSTISQSSAGTDNIRPSNPANHVVVVVRKACWRYRPGLAWFVLVLPSIYCPFQCGNGPTNGRCFFCWICLWKWIIAMEEYGYIAGDSMSKTLLLFTVYIDFLPGVRYKTLD